MFYVYVLVNEHGSIYIGYSSDLRKRMSYHDRRLEGYTSRGDSYELCYYEAFASERDARNREKALKRTSQARRWLKERIADSIDIYRRT